MSTIVEDIELTSNIRVAVVIEAGRIKPVWFEERDKPGRDRIFIKQVCQIWNHMEGAAKIINFSVRDDGNTYRLSLDTKEFTWRCRVAESMTYP